MVYDVPTLARVSTQPTTAVSFVVVLRSMLRVKKRGTSGHF